MKDTQPKTPPPVVAKPKSAVKKEKMPVKKPKETKVPVTKVPRGRKSNAKVPEKKTKVKNESQKKKRGRPKNVEKLKNQEKLKEPKLKATSGRKRKLPDGIVIKTEKEDGQPPPKKPKANDTNHTMNGNSKVTCNDHQKKNMHPLPPSMLLNHTITNNSVNSNGVLNHCYKGPENGTKKPSSGVSKSVTFQPLLTSNNVFNNQSRPIKPLPTNKNIKSILKNEVVSPNSSNNVNHNHQSKDLNTMQIAPKDIKVEKGNNIVAPYRNPVKSHPQRMASLDALAKMHVICIPDRKPVEHHSKSTTSVVTTVCSEPFTHQKSLTQCHQRIQVDVKKESKDFKGSFIHKQIVKEKQQVFVSRSVEQSKTISTKKKNKVVEQKTSNKEQKKTSASALKDAKFSKANKKKSKVSKDLDKKSAKTQVKSSTKSTKKPPNEKPAKTKKTKKLEQTKSEVKVKETIRMQKTCTYQSVTTVNSHGTTNSSVVPLTTNYSKTKKTVVTDEECSSSKNKINYSAVNNSYCMTSDSPCSNCCKFQSQVIPFAHVQACHSLNRTSESTSSSHCDGNFAVHRFSHQPTVIYSPPSPDYGCCCPGQMVQNVHDPCLLHKITYPHHRHSFSSSPDYHHLGMPTSASRCCSSCCDSLPSPGACVQQYTAQQKSVVQHQTSVVPCEPSPLDLSPSASAGSSVESAVRHQAHQPGMCQSPLCCSTARKVLVLRPPPGGFQPNVTGFQLGPGTSACYRFVGTSGQTSCESKGSVSSDLVKPAVLDPRVVHKGSIVIPPIASTPGVSASASTAKLASQQPLIQAKSATVSDIKLNVGAPTSKLNVGASTSKLNVGASTSKLNVGASTSKINVGASTSKLNLGASTSKLNVGASTSKVGHHPVKKEKTSPTAKCTLKHVSKKKQFAHGWSWRGKPRERMIALTNDSAPCPRLCYPSVEHKEGDIINEKDCVLLRSGPKDTDLPYVAKVATFWENPEDGEMMMSLLWYYRPEHTEHGRKEGQSEDEVFASRHRDVNSIACIEDKCYVLTYNEYCRYRAKQNRDEDLTSLASRLVPDLPDGYPRTSRLPNEVVATDIIFFCRHVYDFRQKRILKNPT
ncbi:hypothetical protein JTE90_004886 [Oedothorax gibbosus]|uniref:BAH domain-containing protein n=1 Tax=Oedothorax gibbosus TaxID=931172 RepID=A0AAV6UTG8_9ARAC|nr:hypothetical protein JTE90_004886 [Oedothorax gibbosus]